MAELNFILTGPSGLGKSATGNSILGKRMFLAHYGCSSRPTDILRGTSKRNGKIVTVVDGYVVGWTLSKMDKMSLLRRARLAVEMCNNRVTAFILVYQFGVRATKEIVEGIKEIRSAFGENVLKTNGIVVVSHGDHCELEMADEFLNFQDWCDEQTGPLKSLFEECGSRVVLFDNRTRDPEKNEQQFKRLMEKVNEINQVYRATSFQEAALTCIEKLVRQGQRNKEETSWSLREILGFFTHKTEISDCEKLMEENRCLKEQRQCKICFDSDVSVTFQPCGHLVCCDTCAPELNTCPVCREEISDTVRTYLS